MHKAGVLVLALGAVFALSGPAAGQARLFSDATEHQVVIEGPIDRIVRQASRNTDEHPAALILADGARFDIGLQARGVFRRRSGACAFPPLRLNFVGEQVRGTLFRGQNRLKLVTRCRPGANFEQLLAVEYTAYRLFNEISPLSYRVQPMSVTYRDSDGRRREETQFNFLMEDVDDVARRNNLVALDVQTNELSTTQLDPRAAATTAVFQFMIGNLDWDYTNAAVGRTCCHNINPLAATATSRQSIIPVPYDFDHSGFVDAPYATPPESVPVRNVRTRFYRGLCRHNDQLPAVIEHFRQRRAALLQIIDTEPRLSDGRRRQARQYIEGFFAIADDPAQWNRQMVERCRGQPAGSTGAGAG